MMNIQQFRNSLLDIRHIRRKDSVIILTPVPHLNELDIVVIRKIHMRIRLHAKVQRIDRLKFWTVVMHIVVMDHGGKF